MSIGDIKEGVSRLSIKEQADFAYWIIHSLGAVTDSLTPKAEPFFSIRNKSFK